MASGISRRDLLKLGTFAGITVMLGRVPAANALEVHSGPTSTDWIGKDGKARTRWDGVRRVTGQKNFARDYPARDIPGVGVLDLQVDLLAVRYGDGASDELKSRMTTGGYDFIKRSSVNFPSVQRNNAGVTTYTPAACIVELNVNTFTGEVEIMRHHSLLDPGNIIVPELVSGQQQGGVAMGIGHALMEKLPLYDDGPGDGTWNFNRYILPRAKDVAVWTQTAEYLDPLSDSSPPKGLTEVVMIPVISATGNAITHATGKRFYRLPVTPDKIKQALGE